MRHSFLKKLMVGSGALGLCRTLNSTPRVLFYHGVDEVFDTSVQTLHLQPDVFETEMQYLKNHYEVISMDEYYERFISSRFSGREIVITFDDGYRNNLTVAAPILSSLSLPFTVFVSVDHCEKGRLFPTFINRVILYRAKLTHIKVECLDIDCDLASGIDRLAIMERINIALKYSDIDTVNMICSQLESNLSSDCLDELYSRYSSDVPMNWDELIELKQNYDCIIGSHCLDHFICNSSQTKEETRRQIFDSKRILQQKLGCECTYLAFPNGNLKQGDISEFAHAAVREAGYKLAFTTINKRLQKNTGSFLLPRCAARFEPLDFKVELAIKPLR